MKKQSYNLVFKSNRELVYILGVSLMIGLVVFCFGQKWELILSVIGVGITLAIGVNQNKLSNDRMLKELFTEFNQRYNNLNDDLQRNTRVFIIWEDEEIWAEY